MKQAARILVPAFLLALAPLLVVHPVRVSGSSMAPALRDGQTCLALWRWCAGAPKRGQVWRVQGPDGPLVKRLAGLPGERVELLDGQLRIDGRCRPEPFVTLWDTGSSPARDTEDGYYLLGDNRRDSRDSRTFGPLPPAALGSRLLVPALAPD
jgi:signal peptidase I